MKAALAILAVALVAVPAADGYRNPTPGKAVVLQIAGMHRAKVRRNIVYSKSPLLRMDVYRPRTARGRLPAVLLVGPPGLGRSSGQKIGWAQLIAATGLSAIAFDIRSDDQLRSPSNPARDVQSAIAYVRSRSKRLGIDPSRLCAVGFSAPWHLWATMRDPKPWLRCNVVYYEPLDAGPAAPGARGLCVAIRAVCCAALLRHRHATPRRRAGQRPARDRARARFERRLLRVASIRA